MGIEHLLRGREMERVETGGANKDLGDRPSPNASTPIAAIVSIVSRRLSPLFTLDDDTAKFMVSADRRLAAVSKLSRVRVESSKNTLQTVLPRSAGTLGLGRRLTSAM